MYSRVDSLAGQGFACNLLATLRDRELEVAGKALQDQTGQNYRQMQDGERAHGVYRSSINLASGWFATLDDGGGFSLVPWRPIVEQRLGRQVSAVVHWISATWHLGRQGSSPFESVTRCRRLLHRRGKS
jgi:hypothetical protein